MCLISLFATVTLTFSWMARNHKTGGNGMDVVITDGTSILDYEFYSADANSTERLFKKVDKEDANLGVYDILNDKYQLLMKIYVKDQVEKVTVEAFTQTDYFLGFRDENNVVPYPLLAGDGTGGSFNGKAYVNALSSVVGITVLETEPEKRDGTDYEGYVLDKLPTDANLTKFIADDTKNVVSSKITVKKGDSNVIETFAPDTTNNERAHYFFVYITYDPLLMSTVFSANIGNSVISGGTTGGNGSENSGGVESGTDGGVLAPEIKFICDFNIKVQPYTA